MKILVLEAYALHTGYLGCYGNDWVATPNLDRLAAQGVVFDQHLINALDSTGVPGVLGRRHERLMSWEAFSTAAARIDTWLSGIEPVLWVEGPNLAPPWSLPPEMLDVYWDEDEDESPNPWPKPPLGKVKVGLEDLFRLQNTYAAVVTAWDAQLGKIMDTLRASGHLDDLVLVVTARTGLALAEHQQIGVAPPLHDELAHIPLIFRFPHDGHAGLRITALTQSADLWPTFGEILGIPAGESGSFSLRPLMMSQLDAVRPYAMARGAPPETWLLRTPEWALHLPDERLYAKPDDRWEVNDVGARQPEIVDALKRTLQAFAAAIGSAGPLVYPPLEAAHGVSGPDDER